jgi:V8-like Glu-specific endopeptidase
LTSLLTIWPSNQYKRDSFQKEYIVQTKSLILMSVAISVVGCGPGADAAFETPEEGATEQASICGSRDDSQFVNDYQGNLGPTTAFVRANKTSVGAMENGNTATSSKYCSGTLIGTNVFITAGHCTDSTTVGDYVAFNYERRAGSTTLLTQSHFKILQVIEDGLSGIDYSILRLEGSPGDTFGVLPLRASNPRVGEAISIIGHPSGKPKMVEGGTVKAVNGRQATYSNLDTLPGNSGSSILDANGNIVAIHTLGGCTRTGGANAGWTINAIAAVSSVF